MSKSFIKEHQEGTKNNSHWNYISLMIQMFALEKVQGSLGGEG